MQTDLTMEQMYKIGMDYRRATNNLSQDHAQGTSKMTDNPKFGQMEIEVISQEERQRISDKIRSTLDINKVQVNEERASYVMNN
jgi:exopolysaccharide biosynthesis protein